LPIHYVPVDPPLTIMFPITLKLEEMHPLTKGILAKVHSSRVTIQSFSWPIWWAPSFLRWVRFSFPRVICSHYYPPILIHLYLICRSKYGFQLQS